MYCCFPTISNMIYIGHVATVLNSINPQHFQANKTFRSQPSLSHLNQCNVVPTLEKEKVVE